MTSSRQVRRAAERKNNYWMPNPKGRGFIGSRDTFCRQLKDANPERLKVSARVIARAKPRGR